MKIVLLISLLLILPITSFKALGIDLSGWDDVVYWDTLKNQVKFVILRAGIGQGGTDSVYEKYYKKCKEIGMPVGAYWYSKATTVKAAQQEANYMLQRLKGKKFEYPIYYDIEWSEIFKLGKKKVSNIAASFCKVLEKAGYYCGIYSSLSFFNEYFTEEVKERYDLWIAAWDTSKPKGAKMWQFTNKGQSMVSGITDDDEVDLNYDYVNYPPIIKENHFNGY